MDNLVSKDEVRFVMAALGQELAEHELTDLITDITGDPEKSSIDEAQFLNFAAQQLEGDQEQEMRECFRFTSGMTKEKESGEHKPNDQVHAEDIIELFKRLGQHVALEEAREIVGQGDPTHQGYLKFDDLVKLLHIPPGE
jgi:Ca2+-binding EF-hand superfamily protein